MRQVVAREEYPVAWHGCLGRRLSALHSALSCMSWQSGACSLRYLRASCYGMHDNDFIIAQSV